MSGNDEPNDKGTEPNLFLGTLKSCRKSLIPSCQQAVHEGAGSPADSIATPLGDGGWECDEATRWLTELREHCSGILDAFDGAIHDVGIAMRGEPERVPAGDPHGLAWSRSWSMQRRMV